MKKTNKIFSVILTLVLALAVIPVSSLTAGAVAVVPEIKLVPNRAATQVGDIVSVDVTVSKNSRICGLTLDLVYDNTNFEYVESSTAYKFDMEMLNPTYTEASIRFTGTDSTCLADNVTTIFTAKFKVLDTCSEMYVVVKELYVLDENDEHVNVTMDANFISNPLKIHKSGTNEVVYKLPTCEETGYKTYECCGGTVEEYTPALGHTYVNRVCTVCGAQAPDDFVSILIQEPSIVEVRSEDGIVLHAIVQGNMDDDMTVVWSASNGNFDKEVSGNDMTVISKKKGNTTFTAAIYDADGTLLASDSVELYSKAGFFDRIGGFFRKLFRTNQILPY